MALRQLPAAALELEEALVLLQEPQAVERGDRRLARTLCVAAMARRAEHSVVAEVLWALAFVYQDLGRPVLQQGRPPLR